MIPLGTLDTTRPADVAAPLHAPDPAATALIHHLRDNRRRLELLAADVDPRTVPQGVADAIHDATVAMTDAYDLMHASAWGFGVEL